MWKTNEKEKKVENDKKKRRRKCLGRRGVKTHRKRKGENEIAAG